MVLQAALAVPPSAAPLGVVVAAPTRPQPLLVTGNASACGGLCEIDAAGASSRHFTVSGAGASLRLRGLRLASGLGPSPQQLQALGPAAPGSPGGGSVFVGAGAALAVDACAFVGSTGGPPDQSNSAGSSARRPSPASCSAALERAAHPLTIIGPRSSRGPGLARL